jgi:flagellar biosynthesis protein FlhA
MNMPFSEAVSTFTLLTIGDGLVSQIPALLLSTATGIVVTRVASDGNLSQDITRQIFTYPKLLYVVAATIALLGLITPISTLLTLFIAAILAFGVYKMSQAQQEPQSSETEEEEQPLAEMKGPESVVPLLQVDPIEFEFGYSLIPLADANQGGDLLDRVIMIRRQIALELGFIVPVIRIRDNIQLKPNEYVIKIKGSRVAQGELLLDHYLAMSPGIGDDSITGIETVEPAFGLPALWISEEMKERAQAAGYTVVDPPSVVSTHLTEVIKRHAHELLGRQEVKTLLDHAKETAPAVVEELIPDLLTIGDVQKVLCNLLKEQVSIRNLTVILESLADHATHTKDPNLLTEYARQSLARQITQQYVSEDRLKVITAGASLEKRIADAIQRTEHGTYLALDPESSHKIYEAVLEEVKRIQRTGLQPVILTSPAVRMYLRQLLSRYLPDLPVLSYNELEADVEVQSVGVVNIS